LDRSAGHRDHCVEQDEEIDRTPSADDRRREAAHRLGHDDDLFGAADGIDDRIGVLGPARRVVLRGQPDRCRSVTADHELGNEQVPLPRVTATTGDESKGRHVWSS
jgi:hypothetical protein